MSFDFSNWMENNDPGGSSWGNIGSDLVSSNADNSGNVDNTLLTDLNVKSYLSDPSLIDKLSGYAKNLYQDKSGNVDFAKVATLLGGATAAFNANSGNQGGSGAGYQGGIPTLYAGRNMITAPPTTIGGKPRRAGGAGINYGGDVTFFNTKKEVDEQKAAADAAAAAAAAKDTTKVDTTKVDTTNVDTTKVDTTKADLKLIGSEGYRNYIAGGGTPEGFIKTINDWIAGQPNLTEKQLRAKMAEVKITDADLQTALAASNFSEADKYALTHNTGKSAVNQSINNWFALFPNATPAQIADAKVAAKTEWGITQADIDDALALPAQNKAAAVAAGVKPATEQNIYDLYKGALDGKTSAATVANAVASSGLSTADLAKTFNLDAGALDYLRNQNYLPAGYAEGGLATGRYLQGGTDGMADKIPAQIGEDQPAALSHGEFVVPFLQQWYMRIFEFFQPETF